MPLQTHPHPVIYRDYTCRVSFSHYNSDPNRVAIVANDWETGEPVAAFTRNIDGIKDGEVAIDVNNCGTQIVTILQQAGIIGEKITTLHSGWCIYPVHKLLI